MKGKVVKTIAAGAWYIPPDGLNYGIKLDEAKPLVYNFINGPDEGSGSDSPFRGAKIAFQKRWLS